MRRADTARALRGRSSIIGTMHDRASCLSSSGALALLSRPYASSRRDCEAAIN